MPIRVRGILEVLGVLASWPALGLGWGTTLWNAEGVTLWLSGLEDVRELVFIASGSVVGKRVGCLLSKCEYHQYVCMSKLDFKRSSMRHIENHMFYFALLHHTNCQTLAKLCFSPTSIRRLALLNGLKHHTIRKSRSREKPSHALLCCTELTFFLVQQTLSLTSCLACFN